MGWWWSQNWRKSRFLLRAGAVSAVLVICAVASALLLGDYAGFSGWPSLVSSNGSGGTDAGSAAVATAPSKAQAHRRGSRFLNLGGGGLPFAGATVTLPLPGVAPPGPTVFTGNPGGGNGAPGNNGPGNGGPGGGGPNGGPPGGTVTGPGAGRATMAPPSHRRRRSSVTTGAV